MKLERALLATLAAHTLAMVSMAALLLPGMPGGGAADAERIAYIAGHPWLWRLGWFPWQLTALSDLVLAAALLRTPWIPRLPALVTAALTVAGVIPDQLGQLAWVTEGITLAQQQDAALYLAFERRIFTWIAAWATTLYTAAAVGWTWCLAAARTWNRALTALSVVLWPLFAVASVGPLIGIPPALVAGGNAIGFLLLELWLVLAIEAVLRRTHPPTSHGPWAPWRHPRLRWLDPLGNSRFLRALGDLCPSIALRSDIRDVVYVNYLVPAERLAPLVPPGLELERVGPGGALAVFTFLSYRHGGFGPGLLGRLRRLLPSPIQSNWRIHVRHPTLGLRGVHFLCVGITHTPHALLARWLVEGVPMHVLAGAQLYTDGDDHHLHLDPGPGSAPDARLRMRPAETPADGPWRAAFPTWREMLAYVVPQDRVLVTRPEDPRVCRLEIDLGIPLESCQPLEGEVQSEAARAIAGDAPPFAFRVPAVPFLFREARWQSPRGRDRQS